MLRGRLLGLMVCCKKKNGRGEKKTTKRKRGWFGKITHLPFDTNFQSQILFATKYVEISSEYVDDVTPHWVKEIKKFFK